MASDDDDDDSERLYRQVPVIQPRKWEDFAVFRETFLADFDDAEDNRAMRILAEMLHAGMLEIRRGPLPPSPAVELADSLRAVLADLRHLQGYLDVQVHSAEMDREDHEVEEDEVERHQALSDLGADLQRNVQTLADWLEGELAAAKLG